MRATVSRVSPQREYILMAPPQREVPGSFGNFDVDEERHDCLLSEMQRMRGRIYLEDGALESSHLSPDGRHRLPADAHSWHLLLVEQGRVAGCMRYRPHWDQEALPQLGIFRSKLAQCEEWGPKLKRAVQGELRKAAREGIGFGECGGWALSEELRFSSEALRMVLATFSLAQLLGDAVVFSTATTRNGSAPILRRIGGRSLTAGKEELPAYFDPQHDCEMQILRFDSRDPNPKYKMWVDELRCQLASAPVICRNLARPERSAFESAAVAFA